VSTQDVEKLQAWLKTWDLEALAAGELDYSLIDPEVVYEDAILPDHAGEAYRGYDGLTRAARVWLGPFEEVSIELERVVSVGGHIVSVHLFRGKFRHTGMEFEGPLAWLYAFRDGRITHWRAYPSAEEAVEAASAQS
jgi:ketosteroid isomerase-like protein